MTRTRMIQSVALGAALAIGAGPLAQTAPAPRPAVARSFATAYRTDTIELPLAPGGGESEAVYLVHMKPGEVFVYSWSVEGGGGPEDFYSELSGTLASKTPQEPRLYRKGTGTSAEGTLTAPYPGTFGWLFKNDSEQPAKVKLTLAGFYDLPSLRESMGLEGPDYVPFGPPNWPQHFGPVKKK